MFTTFFKKNQDNSDVFKKLIHRLSDMSVQDLEKIDWNDILREKKSDLQFMLETVKETFGNPPVRQSSQCLEL